MNMFDLCNTLNPGGWSLGVKPNPGARCGVDYPTSQFDGLFSLQNRLCVRRP